MTTPKTRKAGGFQKPAHWTSEPPPVPKAIAEEEDQEGELSPTRYGDWVKKGIAIDF